MHSAFERMIPHAKCAVLCIHGICGTPRHFDDFIPLIPEECSVVNLLLDGHGGSAADFSRTSMKKWKNQVKSAVSDLAKQHDRIVILAHSMGTLFALEASLQEPKVYALFLLACPIKLRIRFAMVSNAMKVYFDRIRKDDASAQAAKAACGIHHSKNILQYIGWIPRYLELFREIKKTRNILPSVRTPAFIYQSEKDEMVAVSSCNLLKQNPTFHVNTLPNSGHYYYAPHDKNTLLHAFESCINALLFAEHTYPRT